MFPQILERKAGVVKKPTISPTRHALDGEDILIWDGLFEAEFVASLYRTLNNAEYDSMPDDGAYRSWICPFDPEDFARHKLFLRASEALAGSFLDTRPECLSAQAMVHTFGDFVPVESTAEDEKIRTILYFANAEWKREWAAETILFGLQDQSALAIPPHPGRIAALPPGQARRFGVPSRLTHLTCVTVQFEVQLQ